MLWIILALVLAWSFAFYQEAKFAGMGPFARFVNRMTRKERREYLRRQRQYDAEDC